MSSLQIYASGITHLSDARYFAAMNASHLGFNPADFESPDTLAEILEWVEGPLSVLEIVDEVALEAMPGFEKLAFHGIIAPPSLIENVDSRLPLTPRLSIHRDSLPAFEEVLVYSETDYESWSKADADRLSVWCTQKKVWLDIPGISGQLSKLLSEASPHGIVIKGSSEEKTGLKNYEALDEIIEAIEAFNE